ncbi:MAG: NifB/NifX family molybdenum-iron cluster-binding protein [Halobacteriota archaeon]
MKVLITAYGNDISAPIDPRFGRCRFFIVWDSSTGEFTAYANENASSSGAGISSAQFAIDHNVQTVVTGEVGPHTQQVLQSAGIAVHITREPTVSEALKTLQEGGKT